MTDQEIIDKILEIQVREKISQKKIAKLFGMGISNLTNIINKKQRICESRRKIFVMTFKMYEAGMLK